MTLRAQLENELKQHPTGGATTVGLTEGDRNLTCELAERNTLAVAFQRLRLDTAELANATAADLERIGKSLSERLTYLMEPIRPIELDADACVVQMRSSPPQRDDDGRSYYELLVRRGGELNLRRFRKEPGKPREPIAATVTSEALLRLVDDFEAALG